MKHNIHTNKAPQAIGTYSQAISTGNLTFISGQIPLNPETMEMVEGDFKIRAHQVFKNIKAIAEAADGNLNNIVKLTIFLTDLENFAGYSNTDTFQKDKVIIL